MSKVNYFGDMNVDAEDLDFTEYAKSDEVRDTMKAAMDSPGVAIESHSNSYLKVVYAGGYAIVSPGYAIDALGRTVYLPQDRAASGSSPGAPGYHPAWPDNKVVASQAVGKYVCIERAEQAGESEVDDEGNAYYTRYYKSYSISIEDSIAGMNTTSNPKIPLAKITNGEGYTVTDVRPILRFYSEGSDLDEHQSIEHCNGLIISSGGTYTAGDGSLGTTIHHGAWDKLDIVQITSDDHLYLNGQRLTEVFDIEWDPYGSGLSAASYNIYFEGGSGSLNQTTDAIDFTDVSKYYIASAEYDDSGDISNLIDRRVYYGIRDDMVRNTSTVSGSTVKNALDTIGGIDYDASYLRRDGTNNMLGHLDMNTYDIENVQTISNPSGIDVEGNISLTGNLIVVDGNIGLDSGRTIDSRDVSELLHVAQAIVDPSATSSKGNNVYSTIQAAVNGISSGMIFVRAGTYTITSPITLKDNIQLVGEGYGTGTTNSTVISAGTSSLSSLVSGSATTRIRNIRISGIKFDGSYGGSYVNGISFFAPQQVAIENCCLENCYNGIDIETGDGDGLEYIAQLWIKNNYFYASNKNLARNAIRIERSTASNTKFDVVWIKDNSIQNYGGSEGGTWAGIYVKNIAVSMYNANTYSGCVWVDKNRVTDSDGEGIRVEGQAGGYRTTSHIEGNKVHNCQYEGFHFTFLKSSVVSGNVISGCVTGGGSENSVFCGGSAGGVTDVIFSGNTVYNHLGSSYGVKFSYLKVVSENTFYATVQSSAHSFSGNYIYGDFRPYGIAGMSVNGNYIGGHFYFGTANNLIVMGNWITGSFTGILPTNIIYTAGGDPLNYSI